MSNETVEQIIERWTTATIPEYPEPTSETPDMETVLEWDSEGGCEATDGCWVEADGTCGHGHPSWMVYLSFI